MLIYISAGVVCNCMLIVRPNRYFHRQFHFPAFHPAITADRLLVCCGKNSAFCLVRRTFYTLVLNFKCQRGVRGIRCFSVVKCSGNGTVTRFTISNSPCRICIAIEVVRLEMFRKRLSEVQANLLWKHFIPIRWAPEIYWPSFDRFKLFAFVMRSNGWHRQHWIPNRDRLADDYH